MSLFEGVIVGTVKDVKDPEGQGRIRVEFPWMEGKNQSYWAPPATLMAGKDRGSWFMPEIGDEVLVAFDHGDVDHPYILGFLWNGQDKPPETNVHKRMIKSVIGHVIVMYDPPVISGGDKGYIQIRDAQGNMVELANARITIRSVGTVTIDAPNIYINGRVVAPQVRPI